MPNPANKSHETPLAVADYEPAAIADEADVGPTLGLPSGVTSANLGHISLEARTETGTDTSLGEADTTTIYRPEAGNATAEERPDAEYTDLFRRSLGQIFTFMSMYPNRFPSIYHRHCGFAPNFTEMDRLEVAADNDYNFAHETDISITPEAAVTREGRLALVEFFHRATDSESGQTLRVEYRADGWLWVQSLPIDYRVDHGYVPVVLPGALEFRRVHETDRVIQINQMLKTLQQGPPDLVY